MEDGSLTNSLLPQQSTNDVVVGNAKPATATAVLVFATAVALCGSFTLGCARSGNSAAHVMAVAGRSGPDRELYSAIFLVESVLYLLLLGYSSPAESGIQEDASLSLSAYSVFTSALTVGAVIGAAFSGKVSDLIGRRAIMGLAQLLALFGWLSIAFSESNVWWLDIGRLSVGVGIGALSFMVPVYITEITPKNLRGSFTLSFQFFAASGVSLMFFIGTVVDWRVLALIGAAPSLMQLLGLFFIPESPRWLAKLGRDEELEAALRRLRGKSADISEEYVTIREYTEAFQHLSDTGIINLFQWRYARSLTVGISLMLIQHFGGCTAIISFASSIFELADFSSKVGSIGMAIIQIPTTITSVLLMDKVGRRPLLLVSITGMCSSCFLLGLSFLMQDLSLLTNITPFLVFIGVMVYIVSYTLGVGGISWVIMSEIFPINIKGSAGSLVSVVNWLSALATVFSFNSLAQWSSAGTFFVFSCFNGLGVLFIVKLVPETTGRSIEEIQASIIHLS